MRRLYELDAIRGVAAFVVFAHHWLTLNGYAPGLDVAPAIAVDLFFIVSGFVMARTYESRMRSGTLSAIGFVVLRYRRLFLPMAVGSTIALVSALVVRGPSGGLAASYLLILAFLPTFWSADAFALNLPAWSLFLEIIANALHGAIFGRSSARSLGILLVISLAIASCFLVVGIGRWDFGIGMILSCLPREIAFYLAGIIAFRRFGDEPFRMSGNAVASGIGALSYPLYAVHIPVMWLAKIAGLPPWSWALAALIIAILLARGLNRAADHHPTRDDRRPAQPVQTLPFR